MSLHILSSLLAAIVTCAIGWSVVLRDRRRKHYVTFAILCFNLCLWYLSSFFSTIFRSSTMLWISLIFAVAIPSSAERFFRAFLSDDPREDAAVSRPIVLLTWAFYLLLAYAAIFYPLHRSHFFLVPVFLFVFGSLYYCIYLIYARQRAARSRPERTRLIYLLYGGAAAVTLDAVDFLPRVGVTVPTFGIILTVVYMYFISQTLFHYRLLDIKELLGKIVTLTVLVLILSLFYGLLLVWVGRDQPGVFFFNTIVASFVILVIFEQLRTWVEDRINRWMFREKYEFSQTLRFLRQDLANIIEVPELVSRILRSFEESDRATHGSIYLSDASGASFRLAGHFGPQPIDQLEGSTRLLFLERLKKIGLLTQEGLERDLTAQVHDGHEDAAVATRNLLSTLEELQAGLCIPLTLGDQLLGLLNLRDDRLREAYSTEELDGLRRLAAQAAITLRNSKVYEQMKERDRLAALGQMAAGLAHEIRNPLGAIKGAAQLLKTNPELVPLAAQEAPPAAGAPKALEQPAQTRGEKGDAEKAAAEAEFAEYLGIIIEEVDRLDRVVSQFLGYARPDRGERQEININDVVLKTLQLLRSQAGEVTLTSELAPDLPAVRVDPEQLRQVFLNLGINSLQAMDGRGVLRVSTRMRRGIRQGEIASFVEIVFQDSGKGMPLEEQANIFIPFYTTKEGGTGLGLPICQRIVENHRGRLEVRSHVGKGSSFSVLLPLAETVTGARQALDGD